MIKRRFLIFLMVTFGLFAGVNTMRAGYIEETMDGIDIENPAAWFYVKLTAKVSEPACGSNPGQVSLIVTDSKEETLMDEYNAIVYDAQHNEIMVRKPVNPWITGVKPVNPYNESTQKTLYDDWESGFTSGTNGAKNGLEEKDYPYTGGWGEDRTAAVNAGYDAAWDWYKAGAPLNSANPTAFGATASLYGYSYVYAPGFDDLMGWSAYAYFYGKALENDGWYFTGWSFTEGETDMGGVVGEADSTVFRILPSSLAGKTNYRDEYVYATFQPVRVADYKVASTMNVGMVADNYGETTIVFDAVGERVDGNDFTVTVPETNFTAEITECADKKVTVTVRYTNPGGVAENVYRGNVTLASKSGCSQLTAPVYARVSGGSDTQASLFDGKELKEAGDVNVLLGKLNTCEDPIIVLNNTYEDALAINANVTFDLNGYNVTNTLAINGGNVTLAYSKYGGRITNTVTVNAGKLTLNGGEIEAATGVDVKSGAELVQNGAVITATNIAILNNGTATVELGEMNGDIAGVKNEAGVLTIKGGAISGQDAVYVVGGSADVQKGTLNGTRYGIYSEATASTGKQAVVYGATKAVYVNGGTTTLNNGKFDSENDPLHCEAGTLTLVSGYFKVDGEHLGVSIPSGKKAWNVLAGANFAAGYRCFVSEDATEAGVCRIGTMSYATLEDALAYANNNTAENVIIIMTNDYVLPAGYYTLPANATLIVPMDNTQESGYFPIHRVSNNSVSDVPYVQPYEFRRLTFADGVHINVHGTIELTCTQRASDDAYAAMPHGPYGLLVMEEGSHMTLLDGSELRAWGYMIGTGETDARRGSTVREQFQMGDWKGGSISFGMLSEETNPGRVFPITQYFMQNIESPVKYHPGAVLSTTTSVSATYGQIGMTAMANDIKVVGVNGEDEAMFLMDNEADAENTWVRKWYNPVTDVQTYDVNSSAHIGSMVLDLGKLGTSPLQMNSANFVLPITNNMKIHLLSGFMDFTQSTALLPGAEVEVNKESVISITIPEGSSSLSSVKAWKAAYKKWVETDHPAWKTAHDTWKPAYEAHAADPENVAYPGDEPQEPLAPARPAPCAGELFIYDADNWGNYAKGKYDTGDKYYTKVVKYVASLDAMPTVRHEDVMPADASINVHGTFDTGDGYLYTTLGKGNIFSTNEDAGSVYFSKESAPNDSSFLFQMENGGKYVSMKAEAAQLKNGDNSHTQTKGAVGKQAFMYMDGEWKSSPNESVMMFNFDCFSAEVDMNKYKDEATKKAQNEIYNLPVEYDLGSSVMHIYIKPQEWVEIVGKATIEFDWSATPDPLKDPYNPYLVGVTGNADHTYSDAAGAGRLFILLNGKGECQWWEVEKKDNLYHCLHPDNDTYYYWQEEVTIKPVPSDPETWETTPAHWEEKRFTISWLNWDGTPIEFYDENDDPIDYRVTYGTMAEYLGSNPTRPENVDYTYDFTGWKPELAPVTQDVTYTATYIEKPRMYTIIFQTEGGVEIERQFLTHNEIPVCENKPTKVGHILQWSPSIAAVTGDAVYTATWLEEPPTEYEITFVDYNGTVLQRGNEKVGDLPTPPAAPANKPQTSEFSYVFDHWNPALVKVTEATTYTAVYREQARTYTITFMNGEEELAGSGQYTYGATPVCTATPSMPNTAEYTYGFAWDPQIQTVMGDATYTATFPATKNQYTVTLKANPSGACTLSGAGMYEYNTSETAVTVTVTPNEGYTLTGWSDGQGGTNTTRQMAITADIDLVANFNYSGPATAYTIIWYNEDGSEIMTVSQVEGTATTFTGTIPTKPATAQYTYTFDGWSTTQGGDKAYKNGMTPKATEDAAYYAHFSETVNQYKVTLASNIAGVCTLTGAGTYDYNEAADAVTVSVSNIATGYHFTGWSDGQGGTNTTRQMAITGNIDLVANFAADTYTILWKSADGESTLETDADQAFGAATAFNGEAPTKAADADYTYTFDGWTTEPNGEGSFYPIGTTPSVSGDATYYVHFRGIRMILEITESSEVTLYTETTRQGLVILSDGESVSGQLLQSGNLNLTGAADFVLSKDFANRTWYCVAVPWRVEANGGIFIGNSATPALLGTDIEIVYYDGATRAAQGPVDACWVYLKNQGSKVLEPGRAYMIALLNTSANRLSFRKKTGESILTTGTSVQQYDATSGDDTDGGWNGIANPALFHAYVNAGSTDAKAQRYNAGSESYSWFNLDEHKLVVGEPIYVQVPAAKSIVVDHNDATYEAAAAPARRTDKPAVSAKFDVSMIEWGAAAIADHLSVQLTENKEIDKYTIGQDLVKFGVSTKIAQMWIDRYDAKLCVNAVVPGAESTSFPMSLFAPRAGEYTIAIEREVASEDYALYLTYNGEAIWNLSEGAYVANLQKGTDANYGLRISAKAPQIHTGVDEAIVDAQGETRKVLVNDHVFIIRGDQVYTIDGQLVK